MQTTLGSAADKVRKFICERNEEAQQLLATAADFHISIWELPVSDPWDESLMALH